MCRLPEFRRPFVTGQIQYVKNLNFKGINLQIFFSLFSFI